MKSFCRNIILPKTWCVCLMVMVGLSAQALDTLPLLPDGPSKALLEGKKPICAETTGMVPVEFTRALGVFEDPSLLQNVQDAYCKLVTEDGTPEFTIEQASSNTYFYVNKNDERTDITEVLRKQTSESTFDIVYYSAGKRFFGYYEAVIHVQIVDDGEGGSRYVASVYAYPKNAVSRFFARHLGLVERYFEKKTGDMTGIITTIACNLCEENPSEPSQEETEAPLLSDM